MKNEKIVTTSRKIIDRNAGKSMNGPEKRYLKGDIIKSSHSKSLATSAERSQIPHHRSVKKILDRNKSLARKTGRNMDIARSNNVARFAKHAPNLSATNVVKSTRTAETKSPTIHPMVEKAHKIHAESIVQATRQKNTKSAKTIKNEAIAEALAKPTIKSKKQNIFQRHPKFFNIFTISLILIAIIGYISYINTPNLSVMIASAQAGIDATYPEYHPDGYKLSGPVTYSDGQVTINFRGNTGSSKFVIRQAKSSWDSSAVKDMVDKESKGQFVTTEERGLTIYTYNGNAAWVNGGILYTISGNAPLSGDQIRRIATSL